MRRFTVGRSWRYDSESMIFYMTLSSLELQKRREKLQNKSFILIVRKRVSGVDFEDDINIIRGEVRRFPRFLHDDLPIEADCKEANFDIKEGVILEAHVLQIPENFNPGAYQTIWEMLENGAELLDSVGRTVPK
jgi:hypothetical protein